MALVTSNNNYYGGVSSVSEEANSGFVSELATHRLYQTQLATETKNHNEMTELLLSLPPLGLHLRKESSFLDLIETRLNPQELRSNFPTETTATTNHNNQVEPIVKKASKLNASVIKIGSWQRVALHEEDVVTKCYFAKKKLVWEILERGLKSKIEIQWEYIMGMRVSLEENQPGILEVELSEPPTFFKETDPQPRRHTLWSSASDFTDGQATICRIHHIQFAPGAFDRHYEKLLLCEPRFLHMCRSPFPSYKNQSSFFYSNFPNTPTTHNISFTYDNGTKQQQHPSSTISTNMSYFPEQHHQAYHEPSNFLSHFTSPVMDLSQALDELLGNEHDDDEACWAQQMTNDHRDERQGLYSTIVTVTPPQNHNGAAGVYDDSFSQFQSCEEQQLLSFSEFDQVANSNIITQQQFMGISINHPFGSLTSMEEARINVAAISLMNNHNYGQENYEKNFTTRDGLKYSLFDPFRFTPM
ncbi:uncharacterized protein LOC133788398 isoform X2 [Humulus lupulus]|uniref:uncharacterized protein LOC133788398 isoform X2 n=1 Tax=Humulus lupulus TaxID=3486 RepID=UPI002B403488|nr:uncharacterized protein LOC133788398 isoform X2 [Humulus lupulus]